MSRVRASPWILAASILNLHRGAGAAGRGGSRPPPPFVEATVWLPAELHGTFLGRAAAFSTLPLPSGTLRAWSPRADPTGCGAYDLPASGDARVVVVRQGGCDFLRKTLQAQTAGAAGVVVVSREGLLLMTAEDETSREAGAKIFALSVQASAGEQTAHGSWRNPPEARLCTRLLARLLGAAEELGEGAVARDVAVLTPYKAQQDLLSQELQRQKLPLQAGLVHTVDAFQGRECEVIVFSAVRAPPPVAPDVTRFRASVGVGFLGDERRLNVAITRAKSMLLVVGHAPTLSRSPGWSALLQHARATPGAYRKVRDEVAEDWLGSSSPLGNAARAKGGKKGAM
mmetsp:Transcript_35532/g.102160  ORF Transcript_35532/g.102160 Transcript_35532/m.102160 type:complete len:342 (+) Transcript_35532:66-1091(+)